MAATEVGLADSLAVLVANTAALSDPDFDLWADEPAAPTPEWRPPADGPATPLGITDRRLFAADAREERAAWLEARRVRLLAQEAELRADTAGGAPLRAADLAAVAADLDEVEDALAVAEMDPDGLYPGLTAADVTVECSGRRCGALLLKAGTARGRAGVPGEVADVRRGRPVCRACAEREGLN